MIHTYSFRTKDMGIVLASVVLGILFFIFNWLRSHEGTKIERPIPEPAGAWPLLGHIKLLSKLDHVNLGSIADECGPLFMLRLAMHNVLVVNNWEMAKECLITNHRAFAGRPKSIAIENLSYNYAVFGFSQYGPFWRQVRKIIVLELLSNRRLDMLSHVGESEVKKSVKMIHEMVGGNKNLVLEMKRWFGDLTLNITLKVVAGKRLASEEDEEEWDRCRAALREYFEVVSMLVIGDGLPFLRWLDFGGYERRMKRTAKKLDHLLQGWVDDHKQRRNSGEVKVEEDFMDIMVAILDGEVEEKTRYGADTINKATCLGLILGSSETTAATLSWVFSELLNNRRILKNVQEEIDVSIGKERQVRKSDLDNLIYLQAVIKETLRLHPPVTLIPRQTMEDCTVAGHHIPSGTRVLVNDWKIHRDPSVWPDPLEFRPERFLTNHKDVDVKGQHCELIPFGTGTRVCPGISFGLHSVQFTVACLLQAFDISTPSNEQIDMSEGYGLSNMKSTPIQVILTPRISSSIY